MNTEELKKFVAFMEANRLLVLSVESEGLRLNLVREGAGHVVVQLPGGAGRAAPAALSAGEPVEVTTAPTAPAANRETIASPLVGTFYRASSPGVPPFVEVGREIKEGDVVCIIEAMKVMNQVKSTCRGRVVEIKAENASPVEYGQALVVVETG